MLAKLVYGKKLSIVPARLKHRWPQRMFLKSFLDGLRIDCVVDVGANEGQYASELRRIGYKGLILSFEPDPAVFERLRERTNADPRWLAFNVALGINSNPASFNIMNVSLFNSFRKPSEKQTSHYQGANKIYKTITVKVERLDEIFSALKNEHRFNRVFLKMDTQGYDTQVFRGAERIHSEIWGLQSEVPIQKIYEDMEDWADQIDIYRACGYEIAGMYAVNPGEPTVFELDVYFRRSKAD